MNKKTYIHAGAHRTGTSSFQMCLDLNREALSNANFDSAYPGRDGIPGGKLQLKLPGPGTGQGAQKAMIGPVAEELSSHSSDPARALILSEENIPGRMFHFYKGLFFPAAEKRLKVLKSALQQVGCSEIERVVIVLRQYDAMFASAYRKRAEDNRVDPFRTIAPRMVAIDRGWPALVRAIKSILAPRELVVLEYGQRGSSRELLRQLVPEFSGALAEPETVLNLSATDKALEVLQQRYHDGETLNRAAWQDIIRSHADQKESTGFADFTSEERAQLVDRYALHLDKIARIRGITFRR